MIRIFRHYIPRSVFWLGLSECLILLLAIAGGLEIRYAQLDMDEVVLTRHILEISTFVSGVYLSMLAVGMYHTDSLRDLRVTIIRLIIAFFFSFVLMSVVLYIFPAINIWRSIFSIAMSLAFAGILLARVAFVQIADISGFKRRVLVLGAARRANRIEVMEKTSSSQGFVCVGFVWMGRAKPEVSGKIINYREGILLKVCQNLAVDEIVIAVEERRGALPVEDLLAAKANGVKVSDSASFLEREMGRVDLDSINPSWLIFSDGFGKTSRVDLIFKRVFDITVSLVILLLTAPILVMTVVAVKVTSPGPIFYRQERVGLNGSIFSVMKFRSMRQDAERDGVPVWAAQGDARVTTVGKFIRATRIDEIPQIFNVFLGDMSFVGPRPERPFFVDSLKKEIPFYDERHRVKPGITGWAQINYPYGASVEDAKKKLEYDLYYIKNCSIFLDFLILVQTLRVVLWPDGVR
jgi:sugar transferase (PEP-CTERM system associated)